MMEDEVVAAQLEELVTPAVVAQEKYYRQLGMRDRILNLPLMVAAVRLIARLLQWRLLAIENDPKAKRASKMVVNDTIMGIIKSIRKPFKKLIIDPFPERVSRNGSFFFEPSPQPCLTTALAP